MKIFGTLIVIILVVVIGGFAYIAGSDVPVQTTTITKDLSADQLK